MTMKGINKHNLKIVIADDDQDDRELFGEAVDELKIDCTLDYCVNGRDLLDYLNNPKNRIPDLVFLDINMPIMSGMESLEQIRNDENFKKIPVIAIYSTSSSENDKLQSLSLGANAYITKPTNFNELKAVLEKVITIDWDSRPSKPDMQNFIISAK